MRYRENHSVGWIPGRSIGPTSSLVAAMGKAKFVPCCMLMILCALIIALPAPAAAQAEEGVEPVGWIVAAGEPAGIYPTAYDACEAHWYDVMGDVSGSRFIGVREKSDDWTNVKCEWTRTQYLCPEETEGTNLGCSTRIPGSVYLICPDGYLANRDGYCRLNAQAERPCSDPCSNDGRVNPKTGNPVVLATGAKVLSSLDYQSSDGLLEIRRHYRSTQFGNDIQRAVLPRSMARGLDGLWNFGFNREIQLGVVDGTPTSPDATVAVLLPDGTAYGFVLQSDGSWVESNSMGASYASNNLKLEYVGALPSDLGTIRNIPSTWRLTDQEDTVWTLQTRRGPNGGHYHFGWPITMERRDGYSQTFAYASDGSLSSISDSFGRVVSFEWELFDVTTLENPTYGVLPIPAAISAIDLPDGTRLEYSYDEARIEPVGRYASAAWSGGTWSGGSAPRGARDVVYQLTLNLDITRLHGVERIATDQSILASVTYLHESSWIPKHVTGIVDHRGVRVSTYSYDHLGRVLDTQGAEGAHSKSIAYATDGSARTRTITHELGATETLTFAKFSTGSSDFRLSSIATASSPNTAASNTALSYGADTFLASTTDAEGRQTEVTRDARGRPIRITEARGTVDERVTTIAWHAEFNVPASIVTNDLTETRGYDADGRMVSLTLTDTTSQALPYATNGQTRSYAYSWDGNGRLLSEDGPMPASGGNDDITSYSYDAGGNLLTVTNALGHVTTFAGHDANGRPASMTDPNGVVTEFLYDPLGRIATITTKHPSNSALDAISTMAYDEVGNLTALTLPGTAPLLMDYDGANRLTSMRGSNGERFDYSYDAMGNVTSETALHADSSVSRMVKRQFDALGRLLSEAYGQRSASSLAYDRVDNLTGFTDPNGFETASSFDALDRVVSTVAPDGGTSHSTYDEHDNPLSFADPIAVTTQFTYNGFGEVIQEISPDRGTTIYEYDDAGYLVKSTDGRGQVVTYTRDILGRVTRMEPVGRPASEAIDYHWDNGGLAGSYEVGRLAKVVDGSGTTLLGYDHRGNRTGKQQVIGGSTAAQLAYDYDVADRITQITYPSGRLVRYGYDSYGRVNQVDTKASASSLTWESIANQHQYEPFGPVQNMVLGNGLAVANQWGSDGRLASRRLYRVQDDSDYSHLGYRRDNVGRIGAIADYVNPANSILFGYDEVGRLTLAVADGMTNGAESYSYNQGTNRLDTFTDDSGQRSISYDGRGNTISESRPNGLTVSASYDGYGRLASYDRNNIGAQSYVYNGLGDRVRVDKPTGTRHFVYDAWGRVVGEYGDSALDVKAEFIWALPPAANDNSPFGGGDEVVGYAPLALVAENGSNQLELYWVHGNHLGVPLVTSDFAGNVVNPGDDFLRPGFPGQSQVLSDLYYNRHRDYDPVTGRYIQADPIGLAGGPNPYLYADGDPINLIDPTGEVAFVPVIIGIGIGVGTELLLQGFDNYRRGRSFLNVKCYDWGEVAFAGALGGLGGGGGYVIGGGLRYNARSLTRETGMEWSHFLSRKWVSKNAPDLAKRSLNRRGGLNGRWVTPRQHYRHDRNRYPANWRKMDDRLGSDWLMMLDRTPFWLRGGIVGAGGGVIVGEVDGK
jgi:RHS repeat-associated protein